jgi:hypothetical protein
MIRTRAMMLVSGLLLATILACNPARDRDREAAATGGAGTVGDTVYPAPPGQTTAPIAPAVGAPGTPGAAPGTTPGAAGADTAPGARRP